MRFKDPVTWMSVVCLASAAFAVHVMAEGHADAPAESASLQFQQPLANVPGKTFTTVLLEFAPGARALPHRHGEAFVYAYVLEGAVRSQLGEQPAQVYRAGQDWSEAPGAHHVVTENASATAPARVLVVFVADSGAALKVPDSR